MQEKYPQKPGIDFLLKQAFFYWNKTLLYQMLFSIIYFGIFLSVFLFFSGKYDIMNQFLGAASNYMKLGPSGMDAYKTEIATIMATPGFQNFYLAIVGVSVFLFPLNIGFFEIFRKIDTKEPIVMSDLFAGYIGLNFFKFISYYIFWFFIYTMITQTLILPIIWVMCTLLVAPLMYFQNKRIFEAIAINFKVLKLYFIEIVVCVIVAFLFKYIGFALFLIGGLFTFPIWNSIVYSLYKSIFTEKS